MAFGDSFSNRKSSQSVANRSSEMTPRQNKSGKNGKSKARNGSDSKHQRQPEGRTDMTLAREDHPLGATDPEEEGSTHTSSSNESEGSAHEEEVPQGEKSRSSENYHGNQVQQESSKRPISAVQKQLPLPGQISLPSPLTTNTPERREPLRPSPVRASSPHQKALKTPREEGEPQSARREGGRTPSSPAGEGGRISSRKTSENREFQQELSNGMNSPALDPIFANDDFISLDFSAPAEESHPRKKLREVAPSISTSQSPRMRSLTNEDGEEAGSEEEEQEVPKPSPLRRSRSESEAFSIQNISVYERTPWFRPNEYSSELNRKLHEEIKDFERYITPTEAEHNTRLFIIERLTSIIRSLWPIAEVKVFGSFNTKLYLPTSDIDVVVILDWPRDAPPPLRRLADEIEKAELSDQIKVIDKARVPIIKLRDSIVGFDIDISFNTKNGVKAAEIIKEKIKEFPSLRPLTFVIKQFLLQRNLNEVFTGGLSSYSVVCLIISFLQLHPKLQSQEIKGEANLGVLLIEFFELYGKLLNYGSVGISIRNGGAYFDKTRKYMYNYQPNQLSIEDPQDPDNDIALSSFNFPSVKTSFEYAFHILTTTIMDHRAGKKMCHESLLGRIIEISPQVAITRNKILDAYETIKKEAPHKA